MGSYMYSETGREKTLRFLDGREVKSKLIAYCYKPMTFGFKPGAAFAATEARRNAIWARMTAHEIVFDEYGSVFRWVSTPRVAFLDDPTFGINLLRIGRLDKNLIVQAVVREEAGCILTADGTHFRMISPKTGEHSLRIESTDSDRLWSHWRGFLANQKEVAP